METRNSSSTVAALGAQGGKTQPLSGPRLATGSEVLHLLELRYERTHRVRLARALLAAGEVARVKDVMASWHEGGVSLTAAEAAKARRAVELQFTAITTLGIHVVPVYELPARFLRVAFPVCFFVRGDASLLSWPGAGIIGSRLASRGPEIWAAGMARVMAKAGLLVVSGGAEGIDAAAHRAALDLRRPTLAYLGVPVDRIYPASNAELFSAILATGGALVSEFAPGEATHRYDHARRNRFIAGHSSVLLVAEAAASSGTLGTARMAEGCGTPILVPDAAVGGKRAGIDKLMEDGWARMHQRGERVTTL